MKLVFNFSKAFYQNIDCPYTRHAYTSILHQRSKSYQQRYEENLFPFGIEDFICQHVTVEDSHTHEILGSFKYINLKTCQEFNIPFPLVTTLKQARDSDQLQQVQDKISNLEGQQKNLAYIGTLNVNPSLKNQINTRKEVKKMLAAGIVHCSNQDMAESILVTGTIPNGSHLFINWLGFENFSNKPVILDSVGRTSAYIMEWKNWSQAAIENSQIYLQDWMNAEAKLRDKTTEEIEMASRIA